MAASKPIEKQQATTRTAQVWLSLYIKRGRYSTSNHPSVKEARNFGKLWLSTRALERNWKIMYEIDGIGLEELSDTHVVALSCGRCNWTDRRCAYTDKATLDAVIVRHNRHHEHRTSERVFKFICLVTIAVIAFGVLAVFMEWL